ncbi:hypothetical protein HO173_012790 [Letharia columbiana]|uniref:Uncharacterized protein n=1 Tax=Letharia columbiana TaxID=112416 RepID=A0A8H6FEB8_9LECA|nr:uncharacterized protein HO173_012790 [Letharia columbiana]KAF6225352.1 hypothetical protein HO173_012790 [Letharia columbiana]
MIPGDTDPKTAALISNFAATRGISFQDEGLVNYFATIALDLDSRAQHMERGGTLTFWDDVGTDSEISDMSYECDGSLGAPSVADCDQLEWQGLGSAGQNVVLHPGTTKFFSSIISSPVSVDPNPGPAHRSL